MSLFDFIGSITGTISNILDKIVGDKIDESDKEKLKNEMAIAIIADVQTHEKNIVELQTHKTGNKWVDGFRGIVRPLIALFFMGLFVADKFEWISKPLTDFDQWVMGSIISFYFVLREVGKFKNKDR